MEQSSHLLIVDDHRDIRELVGKFMIKHGFRVTTVPDGKAMRRALEASRIDLVILDLMLPGEDGLSLCRWLRANSAIPIVMLTAMGEETDRIIGLEMGADDYLGKPFNPRELLARVKAVLRRSQAEPEHGLDETGSIYCFAGWTFDAARRELRAEDGVVIPLSSGEYELLLVFVQRPQRVLSRDQLLDLARGRAANVFDRAIDTQVSRLRRKIEEDQKEPKLIKTVWGEGYVFTPEVARQ